MQTFLTRLLSHGPGGAETGRGRRGPRQLLSDPAVASGAGGSQPPAPADAQPTAPGEDQTAPGTGARPPTPRPRDPDPPPSLGSAAALAPPSASTPAVGPELVRMILLRPEASTQEVSQPILQMRAREDKFDYLKWQSSLVAELGWKPRSPPSLKLFPRVFGINNVNMEKPSLHKSFGGIGGRS